MGTSEIVNKIGELSINQRLYAVAEILFDDYSNDPELTAFSVLDSEDFILSLTTK